MSGPVHVLGSAFIGRVSRRNAVRIGRLERELFASEEATMAALDRANDLHTETLHAVGEHNARFEAFLDQLEGISDAFCASVKELRQEW